MTDNKELKRCPFCRGKAELVRNVSNNWKWYFVICNNDKCKITLSTAPHFKRKSEAIAAWNRRAICAEQK